MRDGDNINSEIIYTAVSNKYGMIGYLVVDRLANGSSFGGVRIVPEISLYEIQSVARTMTYKNIFIDNKVGGAKAAIIVDRDNEKYRKEILFEFGKCISPFVRHRMFLPVMDMGISHEELQIVFDGTGCRYDISSWKHMSHEYTAHSCFIATLCALEKKGISIKDATFSVQGFGNVGSNYAKLMCHAGARLVALSNKHHGIIDEDGFDIDVLSLERLAKGDDFILSMSDKKTSHDSVLEKDVTVLLPAANALIINEENWKRIRADTIICAANAPIPYEIERLLSQNDKTVITDFIANCGGSLGSIMDNHVNKDVILHIISTSYKRKIGKLLDKSKELNVPFIDIIIEELEKKMDNRSRYGDRIMSTIAEYILSVSIINKLMNNYMSKKYMSKYEVIFG